MSLSAPQTLGSFALGMARLGDDEQVLSRQRTSVLSTSATLSSSKYALGLATSATIQRNHIAQVLTYCLVTTQGSFSLNGDTTIVAPDQVTYTPRAITGRTLLAQPLLQGYKTMQWYYSTIEPQEWQKLVSFYNPQSPTVTVTYLDENGIWVQRQAELLPPNYGQQQTVVVSGAFLTFTGLLL